MVIDLFHPIEDKMSQFTHDDSQPSLENCDDYFSSDLGLFYEDFQPLLHSDGHQIMVSLDKSRAHLTKWKCYHIETLGIDL
jgi:hypothetical protein